MANFENIKPYSDLVREAAKNGGPDKLKKMYYELGRMDGKSEKGKAIGYTIVGSVGGSIALWEGGKWIYKKLKNKCVEKRALKIQEIEEEEKRILLNEKKNQEIAE